jgi:HAE1 family hydrophobic/amphiphilic exporter-1
MVLLLVVLMRTTPTGLIPEEDTGAVMVSLNTPPGTSLHQTNDVIQKFTERLRELPEIDHISGTAGSSFNGRDPSYGMIIIGLKGWKERGEGQSAQDVLNKVYAMGAEFPDLQMFATLPP